MSPELETKIRAILEADEEGALDLDEMTLNGEWPEILGMLGSAMDEIDRLRAQQAKGE